MAIESVAKNISSNVSEVTDAAYIEGLRIIRNKLPSDNLKGLGKAHVNFTEMIFKDEDDWTDMDRVAESLRTNKVTDPFKHEEERKEKVSCRLKRSVYSEAQHLFKNELRTGGWIHRVVIIIGLKNSSKLGRSLKKRAEDMCDRVVERLREMVEEMKRKFTHYVSVNCKHWEYHGIHDDKVELLSECVENFGEENVEYAHRQLKDSGVL
jgi:hypothetical protein